MANNRGLVDQATRALLAADKPALAALERQHGRGAIDRVVASPALQAAVRRAIEGKLAVAVLPLAAALLERYLAAGMTAPTRGHADAAIALLKLAGYERTPGSDAGETYAGRSPEQLRAMVAAAEEELARRARLVTDGTQEGAQVIDIFE